VYVLSSGRLYGLDHQAIRDRFAPVLRIKGLRLQNRSVCLTALDLYATHTFLDFDDALAAAHMADQGIGEIWSYDQDFDRLPDQVRVEP